MTTALPTALPLDLGEEDFRTQHVTPAARLYGWLVYHAPDNRPVRAKSGRTYVQNVAAGWVDLVLLRGPRSMFVELKKNNGYPTPEQRKCHEALRSAGLYVAVWKPRMWAEILGELTR